MDDRHADAANSATTGIIKWFLADTYDVVGIFCVGIQDIELPQLLCM